MIVRAVEEGGGDDDERGGLVEVPGGVPGLAPPYVGDELVGHDAEGHLGDVKLVAGDELQQQVERAGEVRQGDVERRGHGCAGRLRPG